MSRAVSIRADPCCAVLQGAGACHVLPCLRALPGERLPLRRAAAADLRRAGHLGQVGAAGLGWAGLGLPLGLASLSPLPAQLLPHADRCPGHTAGE